MQSPLDFFFPTLPPPGSVLVGPQEVLVRIVRGLGQSSHRHTLPFSTHGPTLVSPEPQRARVPQASGALVKPTTVPPCMPPAHPREQHSVKRGGGGLSRLCTQPSLTLRPHSQAWSQAHAQADTQTRGAGTQHMRVQTGTYAHKCTLPTCTLRCAPHTEHRHTCLPVHTQQHTGHTLTHAQVASYDAHTLQTNMHRFSCLSCDSQMVGFSQRATI